MATDSTSPPGGTGKTSVPGANTTGNTARPASASPQAGSGSSMTPKPSGASGQGGGMADMANPSGTAAGQGGAQSTEALKGQAKDVARDAQAKVSDVASDLRDTAGRVAGQAQAAAGEIAGHVTNLASDAAETQKAAGADMLRQFSRAVNAAAKELGSDAPVPARYVQELAGGLDRAADELGRRDLGQLANTVMDFARRQPATFVAGTVLTGFVLARFLKSSAESAMQENSWQGGRGTSLGERRDFGSDRMTGGAGGQGSRGGGTAGASDDWRHAAASRPASEGMPGSSGTLGGGSSAATGPGGSTAWGTSPTSGPTVTGSK